MLRRMSEGYIYKLWYEGELAYIGKTTNLKSRISDHKRDKLFDRVEAAIVPIDIIEAVEMSLIFELSPKLNRNKIQRLADDGDEYRTELGALLFEDMGFDSRYVDERKDYWAKTSAERESIERLNTLVAQAQPIIVGMCIEQTIPRNDWITVETLESIVASGYLSEFIWQAEKNSQCLREAIARRYEKFVTAQSLPSRYDTAEDRAIAIGAVV